MFDTMTLTKVVGAFCGALLIYLLGSWMGEALYTTGHGDHGEQAYVIDTGEGEEAAGEAEPEVPFVTLVAEADPADGEGVFRQCVACHKINEEANGVGPHLVNVAGREIGSIDGFRYSGALPEGVWDVEHLNPWLENPSAYASGTSMSYNGVRDREDRAALIAYLIDQTEGYEMPAPVEASAEAPAEEAAADAIPEEAEELPAGTEADTAEAGADDNGSETAGVEDGAEAETLVQEAPAAESAVGVEVPAAETEASAGGGADDPTPEAESGQTDDTVGTAQEATNGGGDADAAAAVAGEDASASPIAAAFEAADPAAGERVWRQCQACHVADQEQNRVGPHLVGLIGREIGSVEGFNYSGALPEGEWTLEELDAWLEAPREYAQGTSMSYRGLRDIEDRAAVLKYIASVN